MNAAAETKAVSRVACDIDFNPRAHGLTESQIRRLDRYAQFALAAASQGITDATLGRGTIDAGLELVAKGITGEVTCKGTETLPSAVRTPSRE